jgi:GNAT superfamily N-acetyltransferase
MPAQVSHSETSSRFTWRRYRPGDEEGLLRLLQRTFDGWPAIETSVEPIDHLRWKIQAERDPPLMHSIIEADGRIIGAVLTFLQSFKIGGKVVSGRQGTDIAADPDFQGQGVGRLLMERGRRESPKHYDFELHVGSRSRHPAMSTVRERVYNASLTLAHEVDVLMAPLAGPAPSVAERPEWSITDARTFDDRIGPFFEEASTPFDLIVVRTKDYLNWRYADPRAGRFRIRLAEERGRLLGYSVTTSLRRHGYIADLLTLPGRADVAESLLCDALAAFRDANLQSGRCWAPHGHPYLSALQRVGFTERRRPRHVTYRAHRNPEQAQVLSEPDTRVHLMIGDSDNV